MKNALFINSLQGGGAERVVISLARGMLKHKKPIELICIERKNSYELPEQLKIHYLTKKQLIKNNFIKLLYIPILGFRLKKLLKKNDFSNVQSHLIRANIINITAKIFGSTHKSIIVNHNMVSFTRKLGVKGRIKLGIMNFFYSRADLILYISKVMQRDFQNTFHFNNSSKVIFNPHKIEEIANKSHELIFDFIFEPDKHYIVTSGRIIERKRIIDIINALTIVRNTIPNVELVVLGDGPAEHKVKEHIDNIQAHEHVHLLGFKSNPFQYIKNSTVFVMASEREGLPNALIESMACKTTVISSDCLSGPREIIAPDSDLFFQLGQGYEYAPNGVLYAIGDTNSLAEIIIDLLNDPVRSIQLAENAYKRIQRFDLDKIVQEHELILN